jgi:hypothetical protein
VVRVSLFLQNCHGLMFGSILVFYLICGFTVDFSVHLSLHSYVHAFLLL